MKKIVTWMLILTLLTQAAPVSAMTLPAPLTQAELAAANALAGYGQDASGYHTGVKAGESMTGRELIEYLEDVLDNQIHTLENYYEDIENALVQLDQENHAAFLRLTSGENAGMQELAHSRFRQVEQIRMQLEYWHSRLNIQTNRIISDTDLLSDQLTDYEYRLYTHRIREATEEIRSIRSEMAKAVSGYEEELEQQIQCFVRMGDQAADGLGNWAYQVMNAQDPIVVNTAVSVSSLFPTRQTLLGRLSPISSAKAENQGQAKLMVLDDKQNCISVMEKIGESTANISNASVKIVDIRAESNPTELELTTNENGQTVFNNTGFRLKNDKLKISIEVSAAGYRTAILNGVEVKKGTDYKVYLAKDTGEPYIAGCSFDGHECLYNEYEAIYSTENDYYCNITATVINPSDKACVVQLMYMKADGNQYYHTMGKATYTTETSLTTIEPGSRWDVTTKKDWRRSFKPGGGKFNLNIDGADKTDTDNSVLQLVIQNQTAAEKGFAKGSPKLTTGQYYRAVTPLKVVKAKVPKPIVDVNMLSSFFGDSLDLFNIDIPLLAKGLWLNQITVGIDVPFESFIPRISMAVDGSTSIIVGKDFGDFTKKGGPLYDWKNKDLKEIDDVLKAQDLGPLIKNIAYGIHEYGAAAAKGGLSLKKIDGSIGFFAGLVYRLNTSPTTGKWTSKELSGVAGFTLSLNVDFSKYVLLGGCFPAYFGFCFTATAAFAGSIGGVVSINSKQDLSEELLKSCGLDPNITGLTILIQFMLTGYAGIGLRGILSFTVNAYGYINILFELMDSLSYRHIKVTARLGLYIAFQALLVHGRLSIIDSPEWVLADRTWTSSAAAQSIFGRLLVRNAQAEDEPKPAAPLTAVDYPALVPDSTKLYTSELLTDSGLQTLEIGGVPYAFYIAPVSSGKNRVHWLNTQTGQSGHFDDILKDAADKKSRYTIASSLGPYTYINDLLLRRDEPAYAEENAGLYGCNDLAFQVVKVSGIEGGIEYVYSELCAVTVLSADAEQTDDGNYQLNGTPRLYTIGFMPDGKGGLTCELNSINDSEKGVQPLHPDYPFWPNPYPMIGISDLKWRMLYSVPLEGNEDDLKNLIMSGLSSTVTFFDTFLEYAQGFENLHEYRIEMNAAIGDNVAAMAWEVPNFHRTRSGLQLYDTYQYRHYGNRKSVTQTIGTGTQASFTNSAGFALSYYSIEGQENNYQLVYHAPKYGTTIAEVTEYPSYRVLPGEAYDLVFYLSKTVGENGNEVSRMHAARIEHPRTGMPTYIFADLDIEVPGSAFRIARLGASIYVYWIESSADAENKNKMVCRLRGVLFDPETCIATDDYVLAQFSMRSDETIRQVILAENKKGYFVAGKNDENDSQVSKASSGSIYSFPFELIASLELDAVTLDHDVIAAGENDTVIVRLTNNGNVAITGFTMEERATLVKSSANGASGDLVETMHFDTLHPENNHLHLEGDDPSLDITGKQAGWRIPLVLDNITQDYWEVKQTYRTFTSVDSYKDEVKTVTLETSEILPGQVAGYKMLLKTPSDWKGTTHELTLTLKDYSAPVNHLKSMAVRNGLVDQASGSEETVTYTRGSDGRMHIDLSDSQLDSASASLFAANVKAPSSAALDFALDNLVVEDRVYVTPDGEKRLSITITNDAAYYKPIKLYCEVRLDDSEEPIYMDLPYDMNATAHARTQNIDMPLSAITGGKKASKAEVTIRGIDIEELSMLDNSFEVELSDADPLRFVVQPQSRTVLVGETVTMTAQASGGIPPYRYQWQVYSPTAGWTDIPGETQETLTLTDVTLQMNGSRYRCIVTDQALDSATSDEATLTVLEQVVPTGDASQPMIALFAAAALFVLWVLLRKKRKETI